MIPIHAMKECLVAYFHGQPFDANIRQCRVATRKRYGYLNHRLAFNIFQVYQFFTIYRQYFFFLNWNNFHEYFKYNTLKSGGSKDHFRQVKVPGTDPHWKSCSVMLGSLFSLTTLWYLCHMLERFQVANAHTNIT